MPLPQVKGMNENPKVYTLREVAAVLRVDESTVYRLIAARRIRRIQGIRHIRVTQVALNNFLRGEGA
jgi:excisionase family DNA binding protein